MFSWLRRKKKGSSGDKKEESSPGGSQIHRYEGGEFSKPKFGVLGPETDEFAKKREATYDMLFGKSEETMVFHEVLPVIPHIDIFKYPPGHEQRDFWTLVTGGMSDLPMTLPEAAGRELARAELVFYCDEPKAIYLNMLRLIAHFPHDNKTWLGPGHTMPNGNPPSPMFADAPGLDTLLFLSTIVTPDNSLGERLVLGGDPVSFLWLVPITSAECGLKLEKGTGVLLDLLEAKRHPHVFRGNRMSYC